MIAGFSAAEPSGFSLQGIIPRTIQSACIKVGRLGHFFAAV